MENQEIQISENLDNTTASAIDTEIAELFNGKSLQLSDEIITTDIDVAYEIQKGGRNIRFGKLRIKPYKRGKKTYINLDQLRIFHGYHQHIQQYGSGDGFPIPEPTGPWDLDDDEEVTAGLSVATPTAVVGTAQELQVSSSRKFTPDLEAINQLVENAQRKATGVIIAEEILAQEFIDDPNKLPEHLRERIKQVRKSQQSDPLAYAALLLESMRNQDAA